MKMSADCYRFPMRLRLVVLGFVAWFSMVIPAESHGEAFARVQSRRMLHCGVSDGRIGFSDKDAGGRWTGMDVDFCRAVAAAVLGDGERVKFFPLKTTARFVALRTKEIDVLARNTTWTLGREAGLKVHFVGVLYYEGQGFMVARKKGGQSVATLKGASICVVEKTTSEENLADYFGSRGWKYQPVVAASLAEAVKAFIAGRCTAYSADRSALAAARLNAPGGSQRYVILPEQISKEPLGPVVRGGDEEWLLLLKWILFALIEAEEQGVSSTNIDAKANSKNDPRLAKFLDADGSFAKLLNVPPGWVSRMIRTVGNYGEAFERNLGKGSALKLDRGHNRLWNQGGLMYSPPFQ